MVTLFEEYRIFSEMIDFCPNYLLGETGKTIIGHCAELILAVYQNEIDPLKLQVQSVRNLPRIHKVIEHVLDTLIDINNEEADEIILHLVDCLIQAINQAEEMKVTWLYTQVLFENLPDPGLFVIDICKSLVIKYSNPIIDDILLLIMKGIHIYGSAKVPLGSHQLGTATKLVEMLEIVFRSQCIKMPVSLEDHCTSPHLHRLVQICLKGLLQYSK